MGTFQISGAHKAFCYLAYHDFLRMHPHGPGPENRGFHYPVPDGGLEPTWDDDVRIPASRVSPDILIYLHDSSCKIDMGLTWTLGHELQHFRQWSTNRNVWAVDSLLQRIVPNDSLKGGWETPAEIDARIVAKRVASDLYNQRQAEEYIAMKIQEPASENHRRDWQFVQSIELSSEAVRNYSVAKETQDLVRRYLRELKQVQRQYPQLPGSTLDLDADERFGELE
jgi:hypothetical protein